MKSETTIKSFFPLLDLHIGGFKRGKVSLICGYPGSGKTSFATTMVSNLMKQEHGHYPISVIYISQAKTVQTIAQRIYHIYTNTPVPPVYTNEYNSEMMHMQWLNERNVYIENDLNVLCKSLHQPTPLLVIIDNLQKLKLGDIGLKNERNHSTAMDFLSRFAEKTHAAVLVLSDMEKVRYSCYGYRPLSVGCDHSYNLNEYIDMLCFIRLPEFYWYPDDPYLNAYRLAELWISQPVNSRAKRFDIEFDQRTLQCNERHINPFKKC